ncbi:hypothetical protein [Brevibacillus laterosporus]|uniref:Polymer-forming cytoskeletal protein n=1 Tax=Brevibacillus laterosporus TaxID=1465 RepID=A0AAP3DL22_BRELA|nr:hypothetical protein [Brevibacillus laterosporus]MCR8982421.1 hypothetical protein [Brevibacillus laterosporus]MCZ0809577.1 hypothetical protein [Brevibacillus laterosporus]MCZ0828110.1 hypothetical protein [Brevibacillus laterosporus]MCZ0852132.1 hypothetical protein [Brevibacillus laterosporus]
MIVLKRYLVLIIFEGGRQLREYLDDFIDGQYVSPLVITENYILDGKHTGTVRVESGEFVLRGTLYGTLDIQNGAKAKIIGKQQGSVTVDSRALVIVEGSIEGTTSLQPESTLIIEKNAKLAGTLSNNGRLILKGVFGGATSGNGEIVIEESGYILKPIVKDGISYYEW